MIKSLILASYGSFDGGMIGNMFAQWEQYGVFSYILPFLLLFALIFAILSVLKIFEKNKGVSGIIAFVVALMALQFDLVPRFFAEIFPRLGVGLAVILVILIFVGIFMPHKNAISYTLMGIAALVVVIILIQTAGAVGWSSGFWWSDNWPMVAAAIFILVALAVIVGTANSDPNKDADRTALFDALFGNGGKKKE